HDGPFELGQGCPGPRANGGEQPGEPGAAERHEEKKPPMQRAEPTELCYRRAVQIHPTRACAELTWAGLVTAGVGLVAQVPAVVGDGAALLARILVARSVTRVGVARVRAAGFEMLWAESERVRRVTRSAHFALFAEIRNRDSRAT